MAKMLITAVIVIIVVLVALALAILVIANKPSVVTFPTTLRKSKNHNKNTSPKNEAKN